MRIQHNIMAMSAYRNYTNNVSAMKKNLEKLSSGYKINRAGDDAAGLAISEKMRAQITGLETAQKNAKDGISLVQTAEGALTEVHDMLNRMVELATQSANGTYDNDTDRYQLQKEIEQLKSEIDRIADSSNFNGIKLLDGSMSAGGVVPGVNTPAGTTDVTASATISVGGSTNVTAAATFATGATSYSLGTISLAASGTGLGVNTITQEKAPGVVATKTKFSIDLHDVKFSNGANDKLVITVGSGTGASENGFKMELKGTGRGELSGSALASAIRDEFKTVSIKGQEFTVKASAVGSGDVRISFVQANKPTSDSEVVKADMKVTIAGAQIPGTTHAEGTAAAATATVTMPDNMTKELNWDSTDQIGAEGLKQLNGRVFSVTMGGRSFSVTLGNASVDSGEHQVVKITGSMTMKDINDAVVAAMSDAILTEVTKLDGTSLGAYDKVEDIGYGYANTNKIEIFTEATVAIASDGTMTVTGVKSTPWTVSASGTIGAAIGAEANFTGTPTISHSDTSPVKVPDKFNWAGGSTKADTAVLASTSITVNLNGKNYTVNFVKTGTGAASEVVLDLGGESADALMTKVAANLKKQIDTDNDAGAGSATKDYTKITNLAVTNDGTGAIKVTASLTPMTAAKGSNSVTAKHFNTQTTDTMTATMGDAGRKASTVMTVNDKVFADGAKLTFGSTTYQFKGKADTAIASNVVEVDISHLTDENGNLKTGKLADAIQCLVDAADSNERWTVGNKASASQITFVEKEGNTKDLTTTDKIAEDFKWEVAAKQNTAAVSTDDVTYGKKDENGNLVGKSLTLQVGDTAESFNKLVVDISDCHAGAMGLMEKKTITTASGGTKDISVVKDGKSIQNVDISSQTGAQEALEVIKAAINYVSDVRGTLGATQNRLDHTINNLSVMTENIQDAESTIRDVDIAEEMMAYTKNNILIQSAQAMLAQANQVPQGVLQLLG